MKRVIMVGPYPLRHARGGISSVLATYANTGLFASGEVRYLATSSLRGPLFKALALAAAITRLMLLLLFRRVSLVHVHSASWRSFYRKSLFVWSARLFKRPVILHLHGGQFMQFLSSARPFLQRHIRRTLLQASVIVAVSESWRARLQELVPAVPVVVLRNPVDTLLLSGQGQAMPADRRQKRDTRPLVVFLGKICPQKGVDDLLRSIPAVRAGSKRQPQFILCGDGEELPRYQELCQELAITDMVEFPGWVNQPSKVSLLRAASVFVLPSYDEGMPISLLEAMAAGLPVVATDVGGIPELVTHEENGLLLPPGNPHRLAQALLRLLNHPEEASAMARANREKVANQFDALRVREALLELYQQVLAAKPAPEPVPAEMEQMDL